MIDDLVSEQAFCAKKKSTISGMVMITSEHPSGRAPKLTPRSLVKP